MRKAMNFKATWYGAQALLVTGATLTSSFLGAGDALAQSMPAICQTPGALASLPCRGTPSSFFITIVEMGLCKSEPIQASIFERKPAECVKTYPSGDAEGSEEIEIASGAPLQLGKIDDFPFGDYQNAYVIVKKRFGYTASYNVGGIVFSTTGVTLNPNSDSYVGQMAAGVAAQRFNLNLENFESGTGACSTTFGPATFPDNPGSLRAILVNSSNQNPGGCSNSVDRLIGSFKFANPISINENAALTVKFMVKNFGVFFQEGDAGAIEAVGGPFRSHFTVSR
ncbi:Uncharacterized conserved secreted protein [Synechococcus sp. RCC307]|nr:Uncharacterized conserved secreted protein [Synechococcus sp. RCC307]